MKDQALQNRQRLSDIRSQLNRGLISYEEAQTKAQPIIDGMNEQGKKIASTHGVRFKPVTFIGIMR